MSFDFDILLRPNESLPPFIIVHLIRHGSSIYGDDKPLTPEGRLQCIDFGSKFGPHVPFITHIVSSPLLRASETAYRALKDVIRQGIEVKIMDQVSGRYDDTLRAERGGGQFRNTGVRKQTAVQYLKKWLGLRDTDIWDRGSVGEVVIVTHGMLLFDLLGEYSYREEDFPNVQMRSYVVDRLGILTFITPSTLNTKRVEYQAWKNSLDIRRLEAQHLREEAEKIHTSQPQQSQQPRLFQALTRSGSVLRWPSEQITLEEALRRDRAMQIRTFVQLKPVEREGVKRISRVPGVQWRDAVFAAPRAPNIPPPVMIVLQRDSAVASEQKIVGLGKETEPGIHQVRLWVSLVAFMLMGWLVSRILY